MKRDDWGRPLCQVEGCQEPAPVGGWVREIGPLRLRLLLCRRHELDLALALQELQS